MSDRRRRRANPGVTAPRRIHRLKRSGPSVLRQIVVVHAEAGANHGLLAVARRVGNPEARRELLVVIMRNRLGHIPIDGSRSKAGIGGLASSGSVEEPQGGLITQAVVDGEVVRDSPGVLGVEREPLTFCEKLPLPAGVYVQVEPSDVVKLMHCWLKVGRTRPGSVRNRSGY